MRAKEQKEEQLKKEEKQQEHKNLIVLAPTTHPIHNSLQHESKVSMPLLSLLVETLKKENKEESRKKEEESEDNKSLEGIAETEEGSTEDDGSKEETEEEKKKKWKDPVVALAERIKQFYANELMQQAYTSAGKNYHANAQYNNDRMAAMQNMIKAGYDSEEYGFTAAEKKELPKAIADENSIGYKISKGDKYQAFLMTDPRGRWHSTWEIVRVMNESADGKLERNDGLHYQGLS